MRACMRGGRESEGVGSREKTGVYGWVFVKIKLNAVLSVRRDGFFTSEFGWWAVKLSRGWVCVHTKKAYWGRC